MDKPRGMSETTHPARSQSHLEVQHPERTGKPPTYILAYVASKAAIDGWAVVDNPLRALLDVICTPFLLHQLQLWGVMGLPMPTYLWSCASSYDRPNSIMVQVARALREPIIGNLKSEFYHPKLSRGSVLSTEAGGLIAGV